MRKSRTRQRRVRNHGDGVKIHFTFSPSPLECAQRAAKTSPFMAAVGIPLGQINASTHTAEIDAISNCIIPKQFCGITKEELVRIGFRFRPLSDDFLRMRLPEGYELVRRSPVVAYLNKDGKRVAILQYRPYKGTRCAVRPKPFLTWLDNQAKT